MLQTRESGTRMKAAELTAVGVAAYRYGQRAEAASVAIPDPRGKQDEPCARSQNRHARRDALKERFEHAQLVQQLDLHGALAAGQHQAIERLCRIACLAQLDASAPKPLEAALVFDESPLNGQHANRLPLAARRRAVRPYRLIHDEPTSRALP